MENKEQTSAAMAEEDPVLRARVSEMLSEGGGVFATETPQSADFSDQATPNGAEPTAAMPSSTLGRWLEEASRKWGIEHLKTLTSRRGRLSDSMGEIPRNMHRVAAQTRLVLELIDDFRDGTYRQISWRGMALLVGGVLYAVSPADVVPDVIPILGTMDDLAVVAVVTRLLNRELRDYCEFKGYDPSEYFSD